MPYLRKQVYVHLCVFELQRSQTWWYNMEKKNSRTVSRLVSHTHARHSTHTAHATGGTASRTIFLHLDDGGLSRDHERGDTARISDGSTHDLGGVNDTTLGHVAVLANGGIETVVLNIGLEQLVDDDGALEAGVGADSLARDLACLLDDLDADVLVEVGTLKVVELLGSVEEGNTTAGNDTLITGSTGGAERILDTVLELGDLNLRGTADLDDGDTTGEAAETLLELLLIVLGGGEIESTGDGVHALLNLGLLAGAAHDDGVVLRDDDLIGSAKNVKFSLIKNETNILADELGTSGNGNILHGVLSVITEAGRLDGADLEATSELVENEGGKGLTVDILSNDKKLTLVLGSVLEELENGLNAADLLVAEEDEGVLELGLRGLGVGGEVRRDVTAVPLDTLDVLNFGLESLTILSGDRGLVAELLEDSGKNTTDVLVTVGRNGGNVLNLLGSLHGGGHGLELLDDGVNGELNTTAEVHGVHASGNRLASLLEDSASKNGGGGGAITSLIVGLGGNLLDEAGTNVVVSISELNLLGNSDTILGDLGRAEGLVNDDVTAARTKGNLDGISEHVSTLEHSSASVSAELDLLTYIDRNSN